jgi:hypothetical protein
MNDDNIQRRLWKTHSNHRFKTLAMVAPMLVRPDMGEKWFGVYERNICKAFRVRLQSLLICLQGKLKWYVNL